MVEDQFEIPLLDISNKLTPSNLTPLQASLSTTCVPPAMGPPGLLPLLRPGLELDCPFLARGCGSAFGVDAFKWLHQAVINHADAVVLHKNFAGALGFVVQKIDSLRLAGI